MKLIWIYMTKNILPKTHIICVTVIVYSLFRIYLEKSIWHKNIISTPNRLKDLFINHAHPVYCSQIKVFQGIHTTYFGYKHDQSHIFPNKHNICSWIHLQNASYNLHKWDCCEFWALFIVLAARLSFLWGLWCSHCKCKWVSMSVSRNTVNITHTMAGAFIFIFRYIGSFHICCTPHGVSFQTWSINNLYKYHLTTLNFYHFKSNQW